MVYKMVLQVDGGCRHNGAPNAIAAAACVRTWKFGRGNITKYVDDLPLHPPPTSSRAELTAVIIALERARIQQQKLRPETKLRVTVRADSTYAILCATEGRNWAADGWKLRSGRRAKNIDLAAMILSLENELLDSGGSVRFVHVPREENVLADELCNLAMDRQEGLVKRK